jgi:hypothetical protein
MTSKKKLIFNTAIIFLFAALIASVRYLTPIPAFASAAKDAHGSEETGAHVDKAHGQKEDGAQGHGEQPAHGTEGHEEKVTHGDGGHGEEAAHGGGHGEEGEHGGEHGEGHGAESWWRFPGWKIVFACLGCLWA